MEADHDSFYLGFPCHGCKEIIEIIIDDASERCKFVAEDVLQIVCSGCEHRGHYKASDVQRYPGRSSTIRLARAGS